MMIRPELFKMAYKKLKSSLYYDKTQSIARDKLVEFEAKNKDIDAYIEKFALAVLNEKKRGGIFEEILSTISFHAFPKKLINDYKDKELFIKNYSKEEIDIEENQYFLDMDIRGHILGVLWLMLIGYRVDKGMYTHSYGNRIRRNLYSEFSEKPTFSPYLFEPYFQQYEGWRDKAMDKALQHMHEKQDVVVLTMDFKRFYYSVDICEKFMTDLYDEHVTSEEKTPFALDLNSFIYHVIRNYSEMFDEFDGRKILPIGFLPSNVLANYALKNFDKAVLDGWNPIYFGRYVDDVIIVDKVETNSDLFLKAKDDKLTAKDIISFFLEQCSSWKGLNGVNCKNAEKYALLYKIKNDEKDIVYALNKLYNPTQEDKSNITVKNQKVKLFYFKSGESDALIKCFRETISKNKSEFRHMPEDEAVFQRDDYSEIYDLQNEETINKFRGITGLSIDKFELSKLLGKHLRISGLIDDVNENGFEKQINEILNYKTTIENYTIWEKVFEIFAINESFDSLIVMVKHINEAINHLHFTSESLLSKTKESLELYLQASLNRALSLVWGDSVARVISNIYEDNKDKQNKLKKQRMAYCSARMVDKSVMPVFIDMLDKDAVFQSKETLNLTSFEQMIECSKDEWESKYIYYPYLVTMYDFSIIRCIEELRKEYGQFTKYKENYFSQQKDYIECNYSINSDINFEDKIVVGQLGNSVSDAKSFVIKISGEKKNKLRLAIANVRLNHRNFEKMVIDKPNRSYKRYKDLSNIINSAIDEKADMLIMPEAYIPFEWVATVARTCARNKMAIVTGIEHVKINDKIFNLTAVILPYDDISNGSAFISFHLKTHYAPAEKQEINGYRLKEVEGKHYELYQWHDCYFPVYCCYELTSIIDRSLYQSYADFLVAIEWNKDVNYYSNILESLSRDIHCYCVQVNSSDYGDSRITKPSKTEDKDIVRTKGGINSTILVDEIDVSQIRDFQLKEYNLQAYDKKFKPTPPGFKPGVVMKKIKGEWLGM